MQFAMFGKALNRLDGFASNGVHEDQAGVHSTAVDQYSAGATFAIIAAMLDAVNFVSAQVFHQSHCGIDFRLYLFEIQFEFDQHNALITRLIPVFINACLYSCDPKWSSK